MGAKEASETARGREVFKYYQPSVFAKPIPAGATPPPPKSSNDTSLTAFAQLGALRLNATRALITLCTRDVQYIIAEATRTLSLRSDTVYEGDDGLWYGERNLERNDGPCSIAMDSFIGITETRLKHLVVDDLSQDVRFSGKDFVTGSPCARFYAAVPLISPKGFIIGVFSILDDNPRPSVSDAEVEFMKDVASTIVAHLETKRAKQQHKRAEKMIRGLGLYIEGKSSLREWWLRTGHSVDDSTVAEKTRRGESLEEQADQEFGIQDSHDSLASISDTSVRSSLDERVDRSLQTGFDTINKKSVRPQRSLRSESTAMSAPFSDAPETTFTTFTSLTTPQESISTPTVDSSLSPSKPARGTRQSPAKYSVESSDHASGARLQEAVLSSGLRDSFARASNLIREGMSVDGALFLDASVGSFGGSSSRGDTDYHPPGARISKHIPKFSSSSDETPSSTETTTESKLRYSKKTCGILGYSTSTRSSLNMHEASDLHLSVEESLLRKLLRRYPHGKVFNFDEDGSLSSSEDGARSNSGDVYVGASEPSSPPKDVQDRKRKKRKMSREAEAKEIIKILPGARYVAFFGLWNAQKERWFAGSLAWTSNPTRVLDPEEDLTYLASFGNCIMAEVSRLNAVVESQMKDSFVSSISHELRSPLHGILASVELLQDSTMNFLQQEMVEMINSCGRTLLDTINHVLDFTKTTAGKSRVEKKGKSNGGRKSNATSLSSDRVSTQGTPIVDLCLLTEEVLEGVYAGSGYRKRPATARHTSAISPLDPTQFIPQDTSPMIIVNMEWRSAWCLGIEPGAWRRLVMNIFGNALKFTETGFIRIGLETREESIVFTVSDSGKGISNDYLKHHLYTPFAQENSLAVGSGLGLSIVRHIADELGGSINIDSEQDSGTEVAISLPLTRKLLLPTYSGEDDEILQVRRHVQGLDTRLVGFDVFPNLVDEPTGILSTEAQRMFYFKDALTTLLKDWYGMNVSDGPTTKPSACKIFFTVESTLSDVLSADSLEFEPYKAGDQKPLILVLCTSHSTAPLPTGTDAYDIVHIQQPIGPRKLAKILLRFLKPTSSDLAADKSVPSISLPNRPKTLRDPSLGKSTDSVKTVVFSPQPTVLAHPGPLESPHSSNQHSKTATAVRPVVPGSLDQSSSSFVLLVEDNAINLKLLVTYMKKLGINYATAENGLLAVQEYSAAAQPFTHVLMDISMPVMDGLEASRNIRSFEQSSGRVRAPIIAITGAASDAVRQEAFSAGIDQFLTKPASLKTLREIIREYAPST